MSSKLFTCQYEIIGKFDPNTKVPKVICDEGRRLGLRGYILASKKGSLKGKLEGSLASIDAFKAWINEKKIANIDNVQFSELVEIKNFTYNNFNVQD